MDTIENKQEQLQDIREVMAEIEAKTYTTPEEKRRDFLEKIKNPYMYKVGDITVKVSFANEKTIDECFENFLEML